MSVSSTPMISVIIPSYNHAHLIGRSLQSVLDQTFENWEAIIIDNHSQDNTDEVVDKFKDSRITLLKIHNNGVIAASRNAGIYAAKGEFIAFLDSDDWWDSRKLALSIAAMHAGADLVYHDLYTVQSLEQSQFAKRVVSAEPKHPMFLALLYKGISIPNSSVVVRRELLTQIGGETEKRELISVEDYDTWVRLSKITEKFVRVPNCLGYYWTGGGNASSSSPIQCERIIALYEQYIGELKDADHRRALGFLAYRVGRIAQSYGDKAKAQNNLLEALFSPISFFYRIKAVYFLIANILSKLFS
jgi:glycosyltransferase involved in cell wall biosynthesis